MDNNHINNNIMNNINEVLLNPPVQNINNLNNIQNIQNIQNQNINNNKDILKEIDSYIKDNSFSELESFLRNNKSIIPNKILSLYISNILGAPKDEPDKLQFLDILLNNGADVNTCIQEQNYGISEKEKINLLMYSIMKNNIELFRLALKYKPDILLEDIHKKNSLFYFITFDNEKDRFIELLNLNITSIQSKYYDPENRMTHNLITFAALKNRVNIISVLIDNNCDINYQIPETGDTAMHLTVKYDNLEIFKVFEKVIEKYNSNIRNNAGETPLDIIHKNRSKISLYCTGESKIMNSQINNQIYNQNKLNMNENESNEDETNDGEDIIIPLKFKTIEIPTYLSVGKDIKLNLNLYENEEKLKNDIKSLKKELEEKNEIINENEKIIEKKQNEIDEIENSISELEKEIKEKTDIKKQQEKEINNLQSQNEDYEKYIKSLKLESKNENKDIGDPALNKDSNNNDLFDDQDIPISEEEFKFLDDKFHSKQYDHNYIIRCLDKDLKDYQKYVKHQISTKKPVIQKILKDLQNVVNEINPNYKVNLYGSYSTGLCLPWSDIDTVLVCENGPSDDYILSKLYIKLTNESWVQEHKYIENTTIPIIKLISKDEFNFHIDISEESEKHFGLKTVELVRSYLNEYKVLEPIILALKTLLNNGNLNNPYTGGLSSYGLILMVVSFIQSELDNEKYNEKSEFIVGETFLNVLGHYGIFFDYNNYVIITYPVNESNDNIDRDNSYSFSPNQHELIIVDPLNRLNNVAKSTFQFMNIKMGFLIAFMVAKEDCECGCHYECMQNKIENTEHCILKRIFNSIKRFKDASKSPY